MVATHRLAVLFLFLVSFSFASYAQSQSYGVYSLSMATTNQVVIFSGTVASTSGDLAYVKSVATGGAGYGSGVQSQNAIAIYGNYLFAVNPASNTLSLLRINPDDPTDVTLVGTPVNTQGEYPDTVCANANAACVANSGAVSTIACYTYDNNGLYLISNSVRDLQLNLTTPPAFHTGPGHIVFTPDGTGLLVVVKGRNPPFYLFPIDTTSQTLSLSENPVVSAAMGQANFDVAFDTNGEFVVVDTNPFGPTVSTPGILLMQIQDLGGDYSFNPSPQGYLAFPNNYKGACWVERSPTNGRFYVSLTASGVLGEVSRSGNQLIFDQGIVLSNTSNPADLVILNFPGSNSDFLFVTDTDDSLLWVLSLGVNGGGTVLQEVPLSGAKSGLVGFVGASSTSTGSCPPAPCRNRPPSSNDDDDDDDGGTVINFYFADMLRGAGY